MMKRVSGSKLLYPIVYLILLFGGLLYHSSVDARLPSAKRECATCHVMWLNEFKRKDVTTLIPYDPKPEEKSGKQDIVSTERMCFSCHDGYVMDSRFLWKNRKHTHPVGVIPSNKIKMSLVKGKRVFQLDKDGKEVFPLNQAGKIFCGTCHSAHGVDWNQKESPIFLRVLNINSSMCMICHDNKKRGPSSGNHPVNKKLSQIPQALRERGSKFSKKKEVICQSCHRVHGSKVKKLLVRDNHESRLCTSCHTSKSSIRGTKHDLGIMAPESKNINGKTVAESGPCSACHIPHEANTPRLWARRFPMNMDTVSSYCLGCHTAGGPAHKKTLGTYTHPVDVPVSRLGITATINKWVSKYIAPKKITSIIPLPLFDKLGARSTKGGNVTCLTCHNPHKWSHKKIQGKLPDPRTLEGDGSNSFLRIAHDGRNRLCTNCHRKNASVELSKHNLSISAPEEKNIYAQTTAKNGACSACHLPHNGKAAYMWAKATRPTQKGVEKMCKTCHNKAGSAKNKLPGEHMHPLQVSLNVLPKKVQPGLPTFLPDGTRNNKSGKLDCATCHNPHQWQPDKPTSLAGNNADVEGQANNSFLRINAAADAKLCTHCHQDKKTILKTDHDLRVTAPKARNKKGQTIAQSGVCGQCHNVHTPIIPQRLWARTPGPGKDVMESMCRSCHQLGNIAENKIPPQKTHPKRMVPANKGRMFGHRADNILPPVFNANGKHVQAGLITCPTCHNPHQWNPAKAEQGTGRNREGDATTSFLRHKNTAYFLCSDCHGEDSLFRYKYFHWKESRSRHPLYKP